MRMDFEIGDKAVYPVHGVTEVVALESRDIGGSNVAVYVLKVAETGMKIMVPTTNAETVGLRGIIAVEDIPDVYSILESRETARDSQTWNRRYREYMDKIKTGSIYEIAEVLRDLCVLRSSKDLSFGERRMLETARNLLVKELALAKSSTENEINAELDQIFKANAA